MGDYKILIVEDNRELARVLRAAVRSLGESLEVIEVPSGEEGLLELRRGPYDLAIIDVLLPGMDGVQFSKKLRNAFPDTKIILISGADEERLKAGAKEVGAQVWFTKPLEFADLLDTIERQLGVVETIFGDVAEEAETAEADSVSLHMADLIADLRDKMQARLVAVVDEVGRVSLQAGSLEDDAVFQRIIPVVMAAHAAGLKVPWMLDCRLPRNYLAFETSSLSIYLASIDHRYALVALCDQPCLETDLKGQWHEHLADTVNKLREILKQLGILSAKRASREANTEADEEELGTENIPADEGEEAPLETDPLLELLEKGVDLEQEEADKFWEEQAAREELLSPVNPKALSYEQADRLGLVHPKKEDEE